MIMIRYSLKQLWRMRRISAFFVLLLTFAVLLLSLGGSMYVLTAANMERFEQVFLTIGTARQVPVSVKREKEWSAEIKDYRFRTVKEYGETIPASVLELSGAEYLSGPEQRPYYVAYDPSFRLYDLNTGVSQRVVLEGVPYEDSIPDGPIRMHQGKVLYSYYPMDNLIDFHFCDHENPEPKPLEAGKTYVMYLRDYIPHGWRTGEDNPYEWIPAGTLSSDQTDLSGNRIPSSLPGIFYEEVTEGFYETKAGEKWLELAKALDWTYHSVPVTPVSDLNLLMSFYQGDAYLIEGRKLDEADQEEGRKVCMISRYFAANNELSVGDQLPLSLMLASYSGTTSSDASLLFWSDYGLLNAEGKAYEPFFEADYTVVGIYDWSAGSSRSTDYALGRNEVLIPASSVTESMEHNIAAYGPMNAANTSFCIPNGSIQEYQKLWEEQGVEGIELQFYDRGYTDLQENLSGIRRISVILLAAGIVTAFLVLMFFCRLFITRQCRRTAIERSMGMGTRTCIVSLLAGLVLLSAAGCILGSTAGCRLSKETVQRMESGGHYSTLYSSGLIAAEGNETEEIVLDTSLNAAVSAASGFGVLTAAVLLSLFMIHGNLKKEPLKLLSRRED